MTKIQWIIPIRADESPRCNSYSGDGFAGDWEDEAAALKWWYGLGVEVAGHQVIDDVLYVWGQGRE